MPKKPKGPATTKQKKKAWGSKQMLASPFAPTFPSPVPHALESALRVLVSIFPEPFVTRHPRPTRSETTVSHPPTSTPDPATRPKNRKPHRLLCGLNEVTRALERHEVHLAVVARDVVPAMLVAHVPVLCFMTGAQLVVLPGDGSEVGAVFGVRRVLAFAIERQNDPQQEEDIVDRVLTGLIPLAVKLEFPWLEAGRGKEVPPFPQVNMVPHRKKMDIG
eukprot:GFKZ01008243.1.p1 GENE.GFKZ01008243.1~~GFKZ01008243.1.p1  ORF type:complete len:219 (-),score=24.35 GFKZ01008243.1:343-999(-)